MTQQLDLLDRMLERPEVDDDEPAAPVEPDEEPGSATVTEPVASGANSPLQAVTANRKSAEAAHARPMRNFISYSQRKAGKSSEEQHASVHIFKRFCNMTELYHKNQTKDNK